jgi:hypothetical protein
MMLDRPLYLWNKDNKKHLYFEVDSCDDGWGACGYQYATNHPIDAEAGKANMFSKGPKRIIIWLGHHTRSKVFPFSIKKLLQGC